MTEILLVCRGNICRSPMALAITARQLHEAQLAQHIRLSSAGTSAMPRSSRIDPRAADTLLRHGYTAPRTRTRSVAQKDFERFDLILAMDQENLDDLMALCPLEQQHKLQLFLHCASDVAEREVPDPYYGALAGFERVLALCEAGARGLVMVFTAVL